MKVELKNGKLLIEIEADVKASRRSASGKTRIVASTNGNKTTAATVDGQPVVLGLNAYIK